MLLKLIVFALARDVDMSCCGGGALQHGVNRVFYSVVGPGTLARASDRSIVQLCRRPNARVFDEFLVHL